MLTNNLEKQVDLKTTPIDIVSSILSSYAELNKMPEGNSFEEIKLRVIDFLFLRLLRRKSPEQSMALLKILREEGEEYRIPLILDCGTDIVPDLRNIALNNTDFLEGQFLDHYIAYSSINEFANQYEKTYTKLTK
ncbi:MAG: hypothetical protein ACRCXZ_07680 [Patescibacteria group bacterium]